jgi:serine/threonine protein kinase
VAAAVGTPGAARARILHRDIKPANCLKRTDARIKLADLGLAMDVAASGDEARETAGTIPFMAPELFDNPPRYTPASDLYALGMTLACFVLEAMPFPRGTSRAR